MLEKNKTKYIIIGILSSVGLFFLFGIPTAVISNSFFIRMIPTTFLDYFFLTSSSILLGAYIGVHYYKKNTVKKCNTIATTGSIGSFLAFGCPICNKLLVLLFGATALMTYFEPYRSVLGFMSIGLLSGVLYWRIKR